MLTLTKSNTAAAIILFVMFLLMLGSMWSDSATMDELAHIPAGFGYLTQLDYRLNPEHPPLLKAISSISAWIFSRPHFPTDTKFWQEDINGQWDQGRVFLYEAGNDADSIIFWSRMPFLFLALLLGWLLFDWTQKMFGNSVGVLTLILFAFSPTVLAHSRYVTTDLGAAFGFFIGIISFLQFLEVPNRKNFFLAGISFGTAQLLKFSLVLLIPLYALMVIVWVLTRPRFHWHDRMKVFWKLTVNTVATMLLGFLLVWVVYAVFTWNYPQERQFRDAEFILSSYGFRPIVDFDLALIKNRFTRPFGQYLLGVLMVNQRAAGGNTAFFLGEVSAAGSPLYFPLLYLLKETLALHILTVIALWFAAWKIFRRNKPSFNGEKRGLERIRNWIENHFLEFTALLFIGFYWSISIKSSLNIGVRHVLPTFPFIYFLVSKQIVEWLRWHNAADPKTWFGWLKNIHQLYIKSLPKYFFVGLLILWMVATTVGVYPYFLTYYNELIIGGTDNGWKIAVDSNYDWGQDLKRLRDFMKEREIEKIALDYFGGGNPRYYLGAKFEPWWSARGPASGWFAISATFRQGAFGEPAPGFLRKPEDSYGWLKNYEPVARAGKSIFIYQLP